MYNGADAHYTGKLKYTCCAVLNILSMWRQILLPCTTDVRYLHHWWYTLNMGYPWHAMSTIVASLPWHAVYSICGSYPSNMGTSNISVEYPHNALWMISAMLPMHNSRSCHAVLYILVMSCYISVQAALHIEFKFIQLSLPICHSTMTWWLNRSLSDHSRSSNWFSQPVVARCWKSVGILKLERDSGDSWDSHLILVAAGVFNVAREDYRCNLPQGFSLSLGVLAAVRDFRIRLKDSRNCNQFSFPQGILIPRIKSTTLVESLKNCHGQTEQWEFGEEHASG